MVRELVVPDDVKAALSLYPHVQKVWESSAVEHREAWIRYIEESHTRDHRERRIDIMIAGLRP